MLAVEPVHLLPETRAGQRTGQTRALIGRQQKIHYAIGYSAPTLLVWQHLTDAATGPLDHPCLQPGCMEPGVAAARHLRVLQWRCAHFGARSTPWGDCARPMARKGGGRGRTARKRPPLAGSPKRQPANQRTQPAPRFTGPQGDRPGASRFRADEPEPESSHPLAASPLPAGCRARALRRAAQPPQGPAGSGPANARFSGSENASQRPLRSPR